MNVKLKVKVVWEINIVKALMLLLEKLGDSGWPGMGGADGRVVPAKLRIGWSQ